MIPKESKAPYAVPQLSQLYREIFQRSIDGIAIIDANGVYVEQNEAHRELTGFSDSDLVSKTPAIHLGEEAFREIARELQKHGWYRGIHESHGKSGKTKKLELAAFAVHGGEGAPTYFVGLKRDITEQEKISAERDSRLRELESLYGLTRALNRTHKLEEIYQLAIESLLSSVGADRASILVYDSDGLMHFKAWHGLSDEYRKAVDGHSPWKQDDRGVSSIAVTDVAADPATSAYFPIFAKEGIRSLAFIPIVFEGQLLGKFMVYYNQQHTFSGEELRMAEALATHIGVVIQRRQAEEILRRSEKLAATGKLAATVAHEINNPLESIMNLAFLIREELKGGKKVEHYLDEMDNELKRVALIARRTLAFYRDTGPSGKVAVRGLLDEIVQVFQPKLTVGAISVEINVPDDIKFYGSASEIRQVFLNLIVNAMEAIGTNGRIVISAERQENMIVVRVCDTGPGIPPTQLGRIFEPFFTTKKETGTGLGLAVSREIVTRNGGTIEAANDTGGGAIISVYLPNAELVR